MSTSSTSSDAGTKRKISSGTSRSTKADRLQKELEELEHTLARFVSENGTFRRVSRKFYERTRKLENNIRRHTQGKCNCKTDRECLDRLSSLIPKNPRPIYKRRNY